jgi:hypothetical protein
VRARRHQVLSDDHLAQLRGISQRLVAINKQTSDRIVATSSNPGAMALAYAALEGELSGADGMTALRDALRADGVGEAQIDAIDALYVRCLLDPSL